MGLFKKPPTPEELEQQKRYEESKVRLMDIHKTARTIYYIDELTVDTNTKRFVMIGEIGKGDLKDGETYDIYSCEGLKVGTMTVESHEEREERHFIAGRTVRTFVFPTEEWDGYVAGQMLVKTPGLVC